jgi:hypothetical protein
MIKYLVAAFAALVAGIPATLGLVGNASFTRDVPVRVPDQARTVQTSQAPTHDANDDHGGRVPRDRRTEPGDDRGTHHEAEPGDDHGDDHGGDVPRDQRTEPGDDRGIHREVEPGDDRGGDRHRGSDDGDHSGHGGHGGDD